MTTFALRASKATSRFLQASAEDNIVVLLMPHSAPGSFLCFFSLRVEGSETQVSCCFVSFVNVGHRTPPSPNGCRAGNDNVSQARAIESRDVGADVPDEGV